MSQPWQLDRKTECGDANRKTVNPAQTPATGPGCVSWAVSTWQKRGKFEMSNFCSKNLIGIDVRDAVVMMGLMRIN